MDKQAFERGFIKAAMENNIDVITAYGLLKYASYDDPGYLRKMWAAATYPSMYSTKSPIQNELYSNLGLMIPGPGGYGTDLAGRLMFEKTKNTEAEKNLKEKNPSWGSTLKKSLLTGGLGGAMGAIGGSFLTQDHPADGAIEGALIGGGFGGITPTLNRLIAATANPNAQKQVSKTIQKHPNLNLIPGSSLITGAVS